VNNAVFRYVKPCRPVDIYLCFGVGYCLYLRGRKRTYPLRCQHLFAHVFNGVVAANFTKGM
jgi:hypothetical protein